MITDMGVYDFFKGKCPNCPRNIDEHVIFGKGGDIQTKYFIKDDDCFRNFYPGTRVPFAPSQNFIIGRTCCCNTIIKACFDDQILSEYQIAYGIEKYLYIEKEIKNVFLQKLIPPKDLDYFVHQMNFFKYNLKYEILNLAMHPKKILYYVNLGYSIDEIMDTF